jgi:hypothetical protein
LGEIKRKIFWSFKYQKEDEMEFVVCYSRSKKDKKSLKPKKQN